MSVAIRDVGTSGNFGVEVVVRHKKAPEAIASGARCGTRDSSLKQEVPIRPASVALCRVGNAKVKRR